MAALDKLKRVLKRYIQDGSDANAESIRLALEDVSSEERVPTILSQTDSKKRTTFWLSGVQRHNKVFYNFLNILTPDQLTTLLTVEGDDVLHRITFCDDTRTVEDILKRLSQDQRFMALANPDKDGDSVLALAASCDVFLTLRFILKMVDADRRYKLLTVENPKDKKNALHRAFFYASLESIKGILNCLTMEEQHKLHMVHPIEYAYPIAEIAWEGHFEVYEMFLQEFNYLKDMKAEDRALLFEASICMATYHIYTETHELLLPLMTTQEIQQMILNFTSIEKHYSVALSKEENDQNYLSLEALNNLSQAIKYVLKFVSADKKLEMLIPEEGETALCRAARLGYVEAARSIMDSLNQQEAVQLLQMRDNEGDNALAVGAFHARTGVVNYILKMLKDFGICYDVISMQNSRGRTILHREAWKGHSAIFREVVNSLPSEKAAEILLLPDKKGDTALSDAAYRGCSTIATYILSAFSNEGPYAILGMQNNNGQTPLHIAIQNNHRPVLLAIFNSVRPGKEMDKILEMKDAEGQTAMDVAALFGHVETFEILRHTSTRIESEGEDRRFSADAFVERVRILSDKEIQVLKPGLKKRAHGMSHSQGDLGESIGKKSKTELLTDPKCDEKVTVEHEEGTAKETKEELDLSDEELGEVAYTALPGELVQHLESLCEKFAVKDSLFVREPSDWNSLVIVGSNASRIPEEELLEASKLFPSYKISVEEGDNPLLTNLLSWNSVKLEQLECKAQGTCELLVQRANADDSSVDTAYAVGVAHVLYSDDENQQLQMGTKTPAEVAQLLEERSTKVFQAEGDPWSRRWVRSGHPLLTSYRYYCPHDGRPTANVLTRINTVEQQPCAADGTPTMADGVNINFSLNDMLLLPLVKQEAEFLHRQLNSYRPSRRPRLVRINTMERIRAYNAPSHSIPIAVKEFSGSIVPNPVSVDEQLRQNMGFHVVFQLTNGKLDPGDSGSIVYLEDNEHGVTIHRPLGMLIGRTKIRGAIYYRAVILNLALKDMEVNCSGLSNLALFRLDHER